MHTLGKTKDDDVLLVKGLLNGDNTCFDILFHRYSASIYKVCRYYRLPHDESEEIVQEVFIKIWENRMNLDSTLSFKSYLHTIAKNIILKGLRKNTLRFAFQKYLMETKPDSGNTTEEEVLFHDLKHQYEFILNSLSHQRKEVFVMNRFEGLSCEEIAIKMGLSKRTVEHHLYHAQKFIREKMSIYSLSTILYISLIQAC